MWEISNSDQLFAFFTALIFGVCYGIFFCLFKALRKAFRHSAIMVFIEDILFFVIIAVVTFLLLLALTNGEIRFFMLLGIFLGFSLFYFSVCSYFSGILAAVFKGIKWCFSWAWRFLVSVLKFFREKSRNCYKYLKKPLKAKG